MIRVSFSMLLLLQLCACATESPAPAVNEAQTNAQSPGENILACTGLPVAGQKCGLELPKI